MTTAAYIYTNNHILFASRATHTAHYNIYYDGNGTGELHIIEQKHFFFSYFFYSLSYSSAGSSENFTTCSNWAERSSGDYHDNNHDNRTNERTNDRWWWTLVVVVVCANREWVRWRYNKSDSQTRILRRTRPIISYLFIAHNKSHKKKVYADTHLLIDSLIHHHTHSTSHTHNNIHIYHLHV